MNEKNNIKTPEETAQAIERMADRLEEMDKAEGVFGEVITDEELDNVAGGVLPTLPPLDSVHITCDTCGKTFEYKITGTMNKTLPTTCSICLADKRLGGGVSRTFPPK